MNQKYVTYVKQVRSFLLKNKLTWAVLGCFILMFGYCFFILMIGFTQKGFQNMTGVNGKQTTLLAIPQTVGLFLGVLSLKRLLKKINIRYLLIFGYALTVISLILISQMDHVLNYKYHAHQVLSKDTKAVNIAVFSLVTFLFGMSISPTNFIVQSFLAAAFTGAKRDRLLTKINSAYCFGAGIIPLVAARFIIETSSINSFHANRYFYFIAIGIALLLLIIAIFVDYRHDPETLHVKDDQKDEHNLYSPNFAWTKKMFRHVFCLIIAIFILYTVCEGLMEYSFVAKMGYGEPNQSNNTLQINLTTAFGLILFIQGLMRLLTGLVLVKYFQVRNLILLNATLVFVGFTSLIIQSQTHVVPLIFVGAVCLGLGLGATWPLLYAYSVSARNEKAAFIGVSINITCLVTFPLAQFIAAFANALALSIIAAFAIAILSLMVYGEINILQQKNNLSSCPTPPRPHKAPQGQQRQPRK